MVHVINHYTQGLQVIMDDKTGNAAQEKKNDPEFLPSMGLGAFVKTADDTAALMTRIRQSDGANFEFPRKSTTKHSNSMAGSARVKGYSEPKPGTSRDYYKGNQQPIYGTLFTLTAGNTMPLSSSTINMEDITDDYDTKSAIFSAVTQIPQLGVKTAEYTRFRYESERPEKGKKIRQYEMDEDKRFLADIKMTNYTGSATVIMHCVGSKGELHPYHLDGDDCTDGVYYKRFDFSPKASTLRITKTIVIQPKAKAGNQPKTKGGNQPKARGYEESLADQKKFLKENNALDGTEKTCAAPPDKQCVHFHVKVYLDNCSEGRYLNTITSAVRNKKDGTEFKIHALTPPSANVNGMVLQHLGEKVYIMVTNETAFPKNVGVVFKNPAIGWERTLKGDDIKIIKKAVIELTPPPYADTAITENVEVDVSLRDEITGKETEPAKFLYIGDEYGVNAKKSKKRKIGDVEGFTIGDYMPAPNVNEQRRVLHALKTRNTASPVGSEETNSSDDTTPHNSLGFSKDNNMITDDTQQVQPADTPHPVNDVSLEDRRTNRSASTQQSQASATLGIQIHPGIGFPTQTGVGAHNDTQQSFVVQPSSQIVTSAESVYTSSVMQSATGQGPGGMEVNNYLQTQQTVNKTERNFDPSILENLTPDMLLRLADNVRQKKIRVIPEFEEMMWERIGQVFNTPEENISLQESPGQTAQEQNIPVQQSTAQSLNDLPVLPEDCHYAIIKGQIMVVKDDIPKPSPPVESQPVSIAGQSVIIQPLEPQQPSDLQIPSDLLKSDYFNQLFAQSQALSGTSDTYAIPVTIGNQPQQPPPAFWRAFTGATCNLDDDDVEIDSGVYPHTTLNQKADDGIVSDVEGAQNNIDDVNEMETDISPKVHKMKLRGKKINHKDALKEYENVCRDIEESGDNEGERKSNNDDAMKYPPKKKYTKVKEKQNHGRGKALYEDDMADDVDDELKSDEKRAGQPKSDKPSSGYGRGKNMKLVKKLAIAELDEDSQGFKCSANS